MQKKKHFLRADHNYVMSKLEYLHLYHILMFQFFLVDVTRCFQFLLFLVDCPATTR